MNRLVLLACLSMIGQSIAGPVNANLMRRQSEEEIVYLSQTCYDIKKVYVNEQGETMSVESTIRTEDPFTDHPELADLPTIAEMEMTLGDASASPTLLTEYSVPTVSPSESESEELAPSSTSQDDTPTESATSTESEISTEITSTEVSSPEASSTEVSSTEVYSTEVSSTESATPTETADSDSGSSSGEQFTGKGTYYDTGLGACGVTNTDEDYIVAISKDLFDEQGTGNPNNNPLCGKTITASHGSKSVKVTVVDRCEGCSYSDLDFSPAAFEQLADFAEGRIDIEWEWD